MANIGIIGGDTPGLVASYVLRSMGHTVRVFEPSLPAATALLPGFKFLERTPQVEELLRRLGVAYSEYQLSVGLMTHGKIVGLRKNASGAHHHQHYRKTRLSIPESAIARIDDPEAGANKQAIGLDWIEFARLLTRAAAIDRNRVTKIRGLEVFTSNGTRYAFDSILVSVPLWEAAEIISGLPDAMATKLHFVPVSVVRSAFVVWDVVYLPFTPAGFVHRVHHHGDGFVCEFSGDIEADRLQSDLNFLFPEGWYQSEEISVANGHLIPLAAKPAWPDNIYPIGVHAKWDWGQTMTNVIKEAMDLNG